jgi:hypothetical protein
MIESEAIVRAAVDVLHKANPLIELRPLMPDGRWWVGLYDDPEKLVRSILGLNAIEATAVYWSLNRIKPRPATNSVGPARKNGCIGNADIDRIRWLFLDIDNKGDRAAVDQLAADVQKYLSAKGWQPPVGVDSGTGRYLLYPCDLPVTSAKMVKSVIKTLKERFDREGAIIDGKCANLGRIARVPGTFNRKGLPRLATLGVAA